MPEAERMLHVKDVADRLDVSKMTVHRLIKAGELPALRVGRVFRIPEAEFERYYAACKQAAVRTPIT